MLNPFKKPLFRHLTAGILILIIALGLGFWFGSEGKAKIKGELKAVKEEVELLRITTSELAKSPKLHVENNVQDVKVKDGSNLHFVPEMDINQLNNIKTSKIDSLFTRDVESFNIEQPPDGKRNGMKKVNPLTKKQKRRMRRILKRERRLQRKLVKLKRSTL